MTTRTRSPYAAPASQVRDAGDRQVVSRVGRTLLWLAFSANLAMGIRSILPLYDSGSWDGYLSWPAVLRVSLAAVSIAALFQRSSAALFWLAVIPNAALAALAALSVAVFISSRMAGTLTGEAADLAQRATLWAGVMGAVCLLTLATLLLNRGKSRGERITSVRA